LLPFLLIVLTATWGEPAKSYRHGSLPLSAWAGCEMIIDPAATVVVEAASSRSASRRLTRERGSSSVAAMTSTVQRRDHGE